MINLDCKVPEKSLALPAVVAWLLAFSCFGIVKADEFPLTDGFPNYYHEEAGEVDWATNCRVDANVLSDSALPMRLALAFKFQWNTVNGIKNRESVFRTYTNGTRFDLVINRGSGYEYAQPNAVRPRLTQPSGSNRSTATVQFDSITLNVPVGGESLVPFEIYGDCDRCTSNQEANPDQFNKRTTWRIFGAIRVKADNNGNLDEWTIEGLDSEMPKPELSNQGGQHDADWYPKRELARRRAILNFVPPMQCYPTSHRSCCPLAQCCQQSKCRCKCTCRFKCQRRIYSRRRCRRSCW